MAKVHQLLQRARGTFAKTKSDPNFAAELQGLKALMQGLKSDDFCLSPEVADQSWAYPPYITDSAAGCMEVYECQDFSLGIFLLKPNSCMPLHDHPGMHGIMKVLFGSMTVNSYTKPEANSKMRPPYCCKFSSSKVVQPDSEPCVLHPDDGNVHEIRAHDEPVAFVDVLAPPYNPSKGRDCTYYTKEKQVLNSKEPRGCKATNEEDDKSVWLRPGPIPDWFTCVPLPYTGPTFT